MKDIKITHRIEMEDGKEVENYYSLRNSNPFNLSLSDLKEIRDRIDEILKEVKE